MTPDSGIDHHMPAAKAGSRHALGRMLQACRRYLLWIARRELDTDLQPKAGPSDIVQDTLLEAQRDFGRFRGKSEAELLAWLRQLLLHNLQNLSRSYRTRKRQLDQEMSLQAAGGPGHADGGFVASSPSPTQSLLDKEEFEMVRQAIARLSDDHRQVLALWQEQELTFEEIGQRMNRSTNAARMLWVRAIEQLQKELT
jgi:RNA polymerase sigma-70 factor (ECF subfamily)